MSTQSNELQERRRVSKVTFSPISSDVLIVRIRKVSSEVREEDIPKMSNAFRSVPRNPANQSENDNHSKCTMADNQKTVSSQTACKEQVASTSETENKHDFTPCLKHAAENISRKASHIPSEKISLCNNCSKSMLSYIFVVQDFLDSLAKEISGNETSTCLQCARQDIRNSLATSDIKDGSSSNEPISRAQSDLKSNQSSTGSKQKYPISSDRPATKRTSRAKGHHHESKRNEGYEKSSVSPSPQALANQRRQQMDFIYNVPSPPIISQDAKAPNFSNLGGEKRVIVEANSECQTSNEQQTVLTHQNFNQQGTVIDNENINQQGTVIDNENVNQKGTVTDNENINQKGTDSNQVINESGKEIPSKQDDILSHSYSNGISQQIDGHSTAKTIFRAPMERVQPNYDSAVPGNQDHHQQSDPNNNFSVQSPTLFRDDVDGIISTLSNVEREIYDTARNRAGWESMAEPQERLGLPPGNLIASEAFVTSCRNNAEAIGCLVVGTSLLLCRTSRTLCVLVSDGVSSAFRGALSSVFQVVQYVRSLDSLGSTKLALLEQPDLGITFEKLNIWRLLQFTKCVYLNPDTLVIQNCDELFSRDELSAVPDIGWPDCFNSGVFVYSPSVHTFWQLLEFAEKQGSYDGGDQGLLNSYFNSWSSDISKKLSFIYNLMANVSYTYTPAFRQFGRDVKIVQFHGSFKPWHVKFFTNTGQISPSSPVHPTYVQFVHIWINIFRISVLRLLSQEIQSYAASQETICAVETLRFFPLPSESEAEFFLTPPSVRLRLAEKKLNRSISLPVSKDRRRKSAEFSRYTSREDDAIPEASTSRKVEAKDVEPVDISISEISKSETTETADEQTVEKLETSVAETDEVFKEAKTTVKEKVKDENTLPGAEVGDYQGMKAWEQGRMDYEGSDSSDNVIKRLQFLMSRPN